MLVSIEEATLDGTSPWNLGFILKRNTYYPLIFSLFIIQRQGEATLDHKKRLMHLSNVSILVYQHDQPLNK